MKAMVLNNPGPIESGPLKLQEVEDPLPGPGGVRLKVQACGLCHTDLHIVEGELPAKKLPLIPGHQVVGVVDRVGEGVSRFKLDDHVGLAWLHSTRGQCKFCREGKENLCPQARFTGYDFDGGLAQYAIAQELFVFQLPGNFSFINAAPCCVWG